MNIDKITKRKVIAAHSYHVITEDDTFQICHCGQTNSLKPEFKDEERKAHAELIAEAFNITGYTGKSPKQLFEMYVKAIEIMALVYGECKNHENREKAIALIHEYRQFVASKQK